MKRRYLFSLMKLRVLIVLTIAASLSACTGAPAPSPQINLAASHKEFIRISVERSFVNSVQVQSNWVLGDISCAPVIWPAGNPRVKQVDVDEKVVRKGNEYLASVLTDRFDQGKCHWAIGAISVNFMEGKKILSTESLSLSDLRTGSVKRVTCFTSLYMNPGICSGRDREVFIKSKDKHSFNAEMDLMHE